MQWALVASKKQAHVRFSAIPSLPSYRLMPCYLKLRSAFQRFTPHREPCPAAIWLSVNLSRSSMHCRSRQGPCALTRNFENTILLRLVSKGDRQRVTRRWVFTCGSTRLRDRPDNKALAANVLFSISFVCYDPTSTFSTHRLCLTTSFVTFWYNGRIIREARFTYRNSKYMCRLWECVCILLKRHRHSSRSQSYHF